MSDAGAQKPKWLLNDPEPGQTHFLFQAAPDVQLSPEAVEALEVLSRELHGNSEAAVVEKDPFGKCVICKTDCVDKGHKLCHSYEWCKVCHGHARD